MLCHWLVDWHLYILLLLCLKVERNSVGERCTLIHIITCKSFKVTTFWKGRAVTLCLRSLGIILIGDSSIFWEVIIPNGLYSEKIFFSKGLSFQNLYLQTSLFQSFFLISKGHYSEDFYPGGPGWISRPITFVEVSSWSICISPMNIPCNLKEK